MPFNAIHWDSRFTTRLLRRARQNDKHLTPIEKNVKRILAEMGEISFLSQHVIESYIVDFCHIERKLIIECDGHAWHSTEAQRYKDSVRQEVLERLGYRFLRLIGWQCKNEDVCKGLIQDFVSVGVAC